MEPNLMEKEQLDRLNGLTLFLRDSQMSATQFVFHAETLFNAVADFSQGRFKCDGGLEALADAFGMLIKERPNVAAKYFYFYSQILNLLVTIYKEEEFADDLSYKFENLTTAQETYNPDYFLQALTTLENQA